METFKKVFINGDRDNLPETGYYFAQSKGYELTGYFYLIKDVQRDADCFDWYLQPLPEVGIAEEYLRLKIISKGGYIQDGKVIGETTSGRKNVEIEIKRLAPLLREYASQSKVLTDEEILLYKKLITYYQAFTRWVLRHSPDIKDSLRGQDHLKAIDLIENKIRDNEKTNL